MHALERCQLDQFQHDKLADITCIDFNMPNIWKTVPDS